MAPSALLVRRSPIASDGRRLHTINRGGESSSVAVVLVVGGKVLLFLLLLLIIFEAVSCTTTTTSITMKSESSPAGQSLHDRLNLRSSREKKRLSERIRPDADVGQLLCLLLLLLLLQPLAAILDSVCLIINSVSQASRLLSVGVRPDDGGDASSLGFLDEQRQHRQPHH